MNDPQHEIAAIERRTRRYWFDDGLAEIATGAGFLLVAVCLLVAGGVDDRLGHLGNLAFVVAVLIAAFGGKYAVRAAKDRFVHPRTGFVSFECRRAPAWLNALVGFVAAGVLAVAASRARVLDDWIPALLGGILAIGFLVLGRPAGRLRFPLAGISCAVVGLLLSLPRLKDDLGAALLFGWTGIVLLVGGIAAFVAYTRLAPPPGGRFDDGTEERA